MTAPALVFLAPPPLPGDADPGTGAPPPAPAKAARPGPARAGARGAAGALRMTRGAKEAAAGMRIPEAAVRACLDAPDDVFPDERSPARTRFRRGPLVLLVGEDGIVLRVERRRR